MSKKKEPFIISAWEREAPAWKFWNKQELKSIKCANKGCTFETSMRRIHSGSMAANLSIMTLRLQLDRHLENCSFKKKGKKVKK